MQPTHKDKPAVVLLSGGMDSATCLGIACQMGFRPYTLAFDYGQRHRLELDMAAHQAFAFGSVLHKVLRVDLAAIGGSALTDRIEVPQEIQPGEIPSTYVPGRNMIFLSLGVAWAEVLGAQDIFYGANQVDFSGYPDCRQNFIEAFENMANQATKLGQTETGIHIRAPLLHWDKAQIVKKGLALGVDFKYTLTCYDPALNGQACGKCPACRLRLKGFEAAGEKDPIAYRVD